MKQFSLAFLICLTALIAVTISHGIATWQLTAAQREIEWLKSARIKAWPEPDLLSVVSLNAPSSSLDVNRRKVHWHWKIMTPPDKLLRICWRTSSKTLSDAPTGTANGNESSIELPAGRTIELQTIIHETEDGKLHLSCNIGGKQHEFTIQSDLKLFEQRGYVHNIAGVRETIAGDPKTPFLLACLRGYANPSVPSDGFKLWVEPSLD